MTRADQVANGRPPLILAAGTINTFDLVQRIDAAAAAGYQGLGLRAADYDRTVAGGVTDSELIARLHDSAVEVIELQSVHGWAGDEASVREATEIEEGCYRVAAALGAKYMMVSDTTLDCPWDEAVTRFAAICSRARERGLDVALEFLPWGPVPDAATAWRIVNESDSPNAGVLVDSWHHFRGAADDDQIRAIPPDRIAAIQIDDAPAERSGTWLEDTRNSRLVPGAGDFDLIGFMRLLDQMGVNAPISVEVLSHELRAMDPADAARVSANATWDLLARARTP